MKDKELKLEEIEASHTLGGGKVMPKAFPSSCILLSWHPLSFIFFFG
jgi:hypothetical protein